MFTKTVESIIDLQQSRAKLPSPVGLVPTMGFLHEGHLSLIRRARKECASVVVTIFVNPTQFAPHEDFEAYPRDIPRDLMLLNDCGVDLVWIPIQDEMYLPGFQTWVNVDKVTKPLEGAKRPMHFRGVTTIVSKLFNAVQPHSAYFGQKDAQQVIVIRRMVKDLNYLIDIKVCPTVREADGLAMSSRNVYLNPQEHEAADVLFRALSNAESAFENGIQEAKVLRKIITSTIQDEPLANMEYVSCADPDTLEELSGVIDHALLSTAVMIGTTRLIDNILLGD